MNFVVAFVTALGVGTWVYSRMMRTTGNNYRPALTVAGVAGVAVFLVVFFLANSFLS